MDIVDHKHNNPEHEAELADQEHPHRSIIGMDEEISQPLSCAYFKSDTPCKPSHHNFIKSLRKGRNSNIACIYETTPFTVQIRDLAKINQQAPSTHANQSIQSSIDSFMNLSDDEHNVVADVRFETLPYDCLEFREHSWLVSTQSMPLRIYRCEPNTPITHMGSFTEKKKNSQSYLAPIQLSWAASRLDFALGGGHRFLCSYNIEKVTTDRIFSKFSKTNVSTVAMIDDNTAVVGTFEGGLTIVDVRQADAQGQTAIMRPHVDAVMSIDANKQNNFIFASNARKDHYSYIWDARKWNESPMFVNELHIQRYGNQRISLCFSENGQYLYCGSQNSEIVAWSWKNSNSTENQGTTHEEQISAQNKRQQSVKIHKVECNTTINSVIQFSQLGLVFSSGCRNYADISDEDDDYKYQQIVHTPRNVFGLVNNRI